jgi:hypothetical protein
LHIIGKLIRDFCRMSTYIYHEAHLFNPAPPGLGCILSVSTNQYP